MPALWLLRHAQPVIAPGVCYGQLDVPADAHATVQAALALGARLPERAVQRCSPLQRCEQLAQALPYAPAQSITDARLQEMHFGAWEGQAWGDIARTELDAWSTDLYHYAPPGGESLAAMLQRVQQALVDSWLHDSHRGTRPVVWITHAGVMRCVQWLLRYGLAQPQAKDWQLPAPGFGQCLQLEWATHAPTLRALSAGT